VPQLDEVINSLVRIAEPVRISFLWRPLLTDPRDDMVLETAVNGRADLLVTFNQKDFVAATKGFAHETLRPSEALNRLRAQTKRWNAEQGMRKSSFPLRLASSLQEEARKTAKSEGVSLNQLINLAVAEKISVLRTEEFFRERGERARANKARKILKRAGNEPPRVGDEVL
jgi:predicted nucleic acid-binding protein